MSSESSEIKEGKFLQRPEAVPSVTLQMRGPLSPRTRPGTSVQGAPGPLRSQTTIFLTQPRSGWESMKQVREEKMVVLNSDGLAGDGQWVLRSSGPE